MEIINPKLFEAITKKTKLKKSQIYRLIEEASKETFLPRNLAALVVASRRGIAIGKFASPEELSTIRTSLNSQVVIPKNTSTAKNNTKGKKVKLVDGIKDPFIDDGVITSANTNAELYPTMYVFENSVRNVISAVMKKSYGENWWEEKIKSENMKKEVKGRQDSERHYPWHSKRGAAPIFYTDISNLRTIINTFYNTDFKKYFGKVTTVEMWIEEIEKTRNILAHNNPVSKKDRERLVLFAKDWADLAKKIHEEFKGIK